MPRRRLIDKHASLTESIGYQVVFHGDANLRRKVVSCDSLEDAHDLVLRKKLDAKKRKPRRNLYTIWLRKSIWNAVVLECGVLKKSV